MVKLWRFTGSELTVLLVIGVLTPIIDHRIETPIFQILFSFGSVSDFATGVANATGGPVFGDLLMVWEQYGAVLAAFLVRKPGAGTLAMTINGFGQVFFNGAHSPHLLYGITGLGADLAFASFRYKRYDVGAVALAGLASQMFWYPIVFFSHGVYLYPPLFIVTDLMVRGLGSIAGNGFLGAGVGAIILIAIRQLKRRIEPRAATPADHAAVAAGTGLLVGRKASSNTNPKTIPSVTNARVGESMPKSLIGRIISTGALAESKAPSANVCTRMKV